MLWNIKKSLSAQNKKDRQKQLFELLLENRNLTSQESIDAFLNPPIPDLSIVDKLPDLDKKSLEEALKTVKQAIKDKRQIIVFGDYDCDGVVATCIMWESLYKLTPLVRPFIPERLEHGYGLSKAALTHALSQVEDKKPLIVTVDNGITGTQVIKEFLPLGIDFVVTDHHQKGSEVPPVPLVHTTTLCGSGVAWLFGSLLLGEPQPIDLVALATVCDLMPLLGINRRFVKHGLKALSESQRPGVKALLKIAGIKEDEELNTYHLGFVLGPRINAVGRLGHGMDALRLLCAKNPDKAESLAQKLNEINTDRQYLTKDYTDGALSHFKSLEVLPSILVLSDEKYHEGVIGLVAGRLTETFHRPSIVMSINGDTVKGSARSPKSIDITLLLKSAGEGLIECGGHAQAAGLKLNLNDLPQFLENLETKGNTFDQSQFVPTIDLDTELTLDDLSLDILEILKPLAPFGVDNPEPTFALKTLYKFPKTVGRDQSHLSVLLSDGQKSLNAIGFKMSDSLESLLSGSEHDFAVTLAKNEYQGSVKLQAQIKDIKKRI